MTENNNKTAEAAGLVEVQTDKKQGGNNLKFRKTEILITVLVIIGALIWWGIMSYQRRLKSYGSVRITVDGQEFGTYSLGKDQKIHINGTNTLRIKDGKAKMIEASCPDHICMGQDAIDERGGFIICLPNRVIVEGIAPEGETEGQADIVVQ